MMRASLRNDERRIRRMKEMKNKRSFPQERNQKNAILVLFFLTTYHKTMWTTKYNYTLVYEDDNDDVEIGEEVKYVFKYKPVV